jgi:hypothetical protein
VSRQSFGSFGSAAVFSLLGARGPNAVADGRPRVSRRWATETSPRSGKRTIRCLADFADGFEARRSKDVSNPRREFNLADEGLVGSSGVGVSML